MATSRGPQPTPNGDCLPGLTARQSQVVRTLARTALAERGLEAVVHADHLETADGRRFGLTTLASLCRRNGPDEGAWADVVERYVGELLARYSSPPEPLTPAQIHAGVHLRLARLDPQMASGFTYARGLGAGFHEMLVHKDGDFVRSINDDEIERVDLDEMRELGRQRLLEVRPDEVHLVTSNHAEAFCVRGRSGFIASKLLVLDDLMRVVVGRRLRWPDGVLVAIPSRHEIVFAPLDSSAAHNLAAIATLTSYDYAHDHAPVSPLVYWWKSGTLHPLFDATGAGLDVADIPEPFWEAWERLDGGSREDVA